jgi:hypothetical protein
VEGAKGRGHSGDPYRLYRRATEVWSQAGDKENNQWWSLPSVEQMEAR